MIDPVSAISNLGVRYGVGVHVDCCLGGFILPFAKRLGYDIPDFDFSLPGVTSMSVDTHKYGYAAKGECCTFNAVSGHMRGTGGGSYCLFEGLMKTMVCMISVTGTSVVVYRSKVGALVGVVVGTVVGTCNNIHQHQY